ncbi:hypothetical protein TeGR_g3945, partial [Tetraparma gracilis]
VPAAELREKTRWIAGWITLEEIRGAQGGRIRDVPKLCFRCKGTSRIKCLACQGKGEIVVLPR